MSLTTTIEKYRVVVPAVVEPVSLDEARDHLRVTPSDDSPPSHEDDDIISAQLSAAREWCEAYTKRSIAQQTIELALDAFPTGAIQLLRPPVIAVESIKYLDSTGTEQTVSAADYSLDTYQEPPQIALSAGAAWPMAQTTTNAVKIRYTAGYTLDGDSPDDNPLPKSIRAAMLLLLGQWYENRELSGAPATLPFTVESLLLPYRLRLSMI